MRAPVLAALIAVAATGCRTERQSQLVVVVQSDMRVPEVLDGFRVHVTGGELDEGPPFEREFRLGQGGVTLPADFGVVPRGGDIRRRVTVAVDALKGDRTLFTTRAITTFVAHRWLRLDIFLAANCIDEVCEPEETCRLEGCVPPDVDPDDLDTFEPGERLGWDAGRPPVCEPGAPEPNGCDAGIDSGVRPGPDSGIDSGVDSGLDSGVDTGVDAAVGPLVVRQGDDELFPEPVTAPETSVAFYDYTPCGGQTGFEAPGRATVLVFEDANTGSRSLIFTLSSQDDAQDGAAQVEVSGLGPGDPVLFSDDNPDGCEGNPTELVSAGGGLVVGDFRWRTHSDGGVLALTCPRTISFSIYNTAGIDELVWVGADGQLTGLDLSRSVDIECR